MKSGFCGGGLTAAALAFAVLSATVFGPQRAAAADAKVMIDNFTFNPHIFLTA